MKEIILGLLSIGMVSCYIASAFYCAINLWYNKDVIDPIIKQSFVFFFVATVAMIICGYDWIVNADYMKIPTWQALGWGIIHVSMPSGFFMINEWICQKSSIIKCEAIKQKVIAELKITNTLQGHVGYLK